MSIHFLCPIFNWILYYFVVVCVFYIFWTLNRIRYMTFKYVHFIGCFFIMLIASFTIQRLFSLIQSYTLIFASVAYVFSIQNGFAKTNATELLPNTFF